MSGGTYDLEFIENGIAFIRETFDMTDTNCSALLIRAGQIVNCDSEGIVSVSRRIMMPVHEARDLGIIKQ